MKLEEYKQDSYDFSKSTSDIVRQLALAGIAIIWIFKIDKPQQHLIPTELLKPLLFMVMTLGFDLLQYFIPSIVWYLFFRYQEKKQLAADTEIEAPVALSIPGWIFYYLKVISLFIGYYYILSFISTRI